ncbi:MAG: hypothetical protein A2Y12_03980 [Planctomycetes bacterium GWF2_42_9]|nr:MAG: hypothetical protein A2Y12_03980 [Planctomycetes bacterium GWF2_42_9]
MEPTNFEEELPLLLPSDSNFPMYPFKAGTLSIWHQSHNDYQRYHLTESDQKIIQETIGSPFTLPDLRAYLLKECNVQDPTNYSIPDIIAALKSVKPREKRHGISNNHSQDFTSVFWNGIKYQFSKGHQAESVKLLWEEWEKGGHTLSEKTIGEQIGSSANNFRLLHVFRNHNGQGTHPAWGKMIISSGQGVFRLSDNSEKD